MVSTSSQFLGFLSVCTVVIDLDLELQRPSSGNYGSVSYLVSGDLTFNFSRMTFGFELVRSRGRRTFLLNSEYF